MENELNPKGFAFRSVVLNVSDAKSCDECVKGIIEKEGKLLNFS